MLKKRHRWKMNICENCGMKRKFMRSNFATYLTWYYWIDEKWQIVKRHSVPECNKQ